MPSGMVITIFVPQTEHGGNPGLGGLSCAVENVKSITATTSLYIIASFN